ncbi:hypothetical protein BCV72DRAFT_126184 [Rhizopus microsporus var. microsporus]|uniref:Uncharacterized protein n=1 Tax=Rhizopus microsporus var. microsporus TaxID=86635 RepID=A0A1X0R2S6_RHIZD|nr:hypothetical protein BCV72DRAFT_126184 [Rhizopus microsporus var. microsporus]
MSISFIFLEPCMISARYFPSLLLGCFKNTFFAILTSGSVSIIHSYLFVNKAIMAFQIIKMKIKREQLEKYPKKRRSRNQIR